MPEEKGWRRPASAYAITFFNRLSSFRAKYFQMGLDDPGKLETATERTPRTHTRDVLHVPY